MKKLILILSIAFAITTHAQTSNYRGINFTGSAIDINAGYTAPRVVNVINDTTTVLFVKFYDQNTQPFSTSTPVYTVMVPGGTNSTIYLNGNMQFRTNMWIRVGKGILNADTSYNKWKAFPPIVEITY